MTTATVKNGIAYFEYNNFSLSNADKVKIVDFSRYAYKESLTFSRNNKDLRITYSSRTVTISDFFNDKGAVVSNVKTIRVYDPYEKKGYKDYDVAKSGILNAVASEIASFEIKNGVITGTAFADTISGADFNKPTGKNKDIGVTIKPGMGNDTITGSIYNDTFDINGSGTKTINISASDGNDTIKGINTKDAGVVLNFSNTVLDTATHAAHNAVYERVGNDLKITATETVPTKIDDLSGYVWTKKWNSTTNEYEYTPNSSDNLPNSYYYYYYGATSFSTKPIYSYQDGETTKYTEYRWITHTLADAYLLTGYNAYDGNNSTPDGNIVKLFTTPEAANAFKDSYYQTGSPYYDESEDTCEITKLSDLTANANGDKILYSYKKRSYTSSGDVLVYSKTAPTYNSAPITPVRYSDMYLHDTGSTYYSYSNGNIKRYTLKTEAEKVEGDIKISDLEGDIYYRQDGYFYTANPYYESYTVIQNSTFDSTYYFSPEMVFVTDYHEYNVEETYFTYNEQNYYYTATQAPTEITGNCTITDTEAPEYTEVDTIYSYVNDGKMAYTFDAQTANYDENAPEPASSTTTIKDYFKNTTAPDAEIGLNGVKLTDALSQTELAIIDRQYQLNKDGSVKLDKNNNPIIQTGKQTINGSFLNDSITGGEGADVINLGASDDTTGDRVNAGKGNDTINIKNYGKKVITIDNEGGNDTITGTDTLGSSAYLNFTDVDVDSVSDAKSNLQYTRNANNLVITRTYTVGDETKTSTTTIKDYFKSTTSSSHSVYFGDGSNSTVSLYSVLSGFEAGTKGTHLSDSLRGTDKVDNITTGSGDDTITGGLANDKITIDGSGVKYIVMKNGDGVDTLNIKDTNSAPVLQFRGADIKNDSDAANNLTYEKSGKNDIKISYNDAPMKELNNLSGLYFYDKYGQNDLILFTQQTMYSESSDYFTEMSGTGLYSYENEDGKTCYSTNKTQTVALNTVYFETNNNYHDGVGYLTKTPHDYSGYTATTLSGVQKVYAYRNVIAPSFTANGKQATEIIYTTDASVQPKKYSELWLKPVHTSWDDYYVLVTEKENDDCIRVADQQALYSYNDVPSYSSDERIYLDDLGGYLDPFITSDKYNSVYYFDRYHSYIIDIDDNPNNGIRKEYTVNNSHFLLRNGAGNGYMMQGDATATAISSSDYTQITTIYSSKDENGTTYSAVKPANFDATAVETSVIIKDYLTSNQYVYMTKSNSTNSYYYLDDILSEIGLTIGDKNSSKAQNLTGTGLNDNLYGGSGKDKITTGGSTQYGRGDIINPGAGDDTITIDGNGYKTINIANADGNDTIIFTDNNNKTPYDYTTNKRLYLNFENSATLSYEMNGKDLVINRSYNGGTASAKTTLKDYFNVDYRYNLANNIIINGSTFYASDYLNNTSIDKSASNKAQTINGDMFNNIITGGSGNDNINGYGGLDTIDGGQGSDTYTVNYNNKSGSKYALSDKITISDSGNGAKDVDVLKLDVKKKDMALLFNVNKITDSSAYSDNDIIVGGNRYSIDNQLMIFADIDEQYGGISITSGKVTTNHGIIADGIEKITTGDNKNITSNNIREIAQSVASWLSNNGFDSTAAVFEGDNDSDILNMLAQYNPDNALIKDIINEMG